MMTMAEKVIVDLKAARYEIALAQREGDFEVEFHWRSEANRLDSLRRSLEAPTAL